jgi:hypothetical protein
MPARGINYPILAGYLLLTLLLVIGGLASIFWDWPGGRTDRAVFLAIVLFLISSYLCVKSYKRLKMIRSGFAKIAGTIDRKWTSPDHGRDGWQGNASFFKFRYAIYDTLSEDMLYFIRVEGLPFVIAESQHRELFEGDSVTITYWPGDKRVESIERRTTSTMVD